jgi:archaellin
VLINTAGFLQQQSQQTGEEATSEVSNSLVVLSETGIVNGGVVDTIKLTVKKSPGAGDINVDQTTIQYTGKDARATFKGGTAPSSLTEKNGDSNPTDTDVLQSSSERIIITINLGSVDGGDSLSSGEEAEIELTTPSGGQTVVEIAAPDSLSAKNDGEAVEV